MFQSFFRSRQWWLWAWLGGALILGVTWFQVQQSVRMNDWYGSFYDYLQKILSKPGTTTLSEFFSQLSTFAEIALVVIVVAVILEFFVRHWVFRWRTAMTDFYSANWHKVRNIEGASQRVQEDTGRFARIMESLGVSFMRSLMTLVAFLPLLWTMSAKVTELPWIGKVDNSLIWVAVGSALFGTLLLAIVGIKLPGLEFANQKVEAAYRKELVIGEDNPQRASPPALSELWLGLRSNYFRLYANYLYFDVAKWSYLQFSVLIPLISLAPSMVAGVITFGLFRQIVNIFEQVESSFQFLVNSWSTIVELISVYKRLSAFELAIRNAPDTTDAPTDGEPVVIHATI
jgi:peptide/bleomycin uptake transporter